MAWLATLFGKIWASVLGPWLISKATALASYLITLLTNKYKQHKSEQDVQEKEAAHEKVVEQGTAVSREDRRKSVEDVLNSGDA